jgi:hypothetical protein
MSARHIQLIINIMQYYFIMTIEMFIKQVADISHGIKRIEENQKQIFHQLSKIEEAVWEKKKEELNSLFLKEEEVAKLLGLSRRTLRNKRSFGEIAFIKISNHIFYERVEVERFLKERRIRII